MSKGLTSSLLSEKRPQGNLISQVTRSPTSCLYANQSSVTKKGLSINLWQMRDYSIITLLLRFDIAAAVAVQPQLVTQPLPFPLNFYAALIMNWSQSTFNLLHFQHIFSTSKNTNS